MEGGNGLTDVAMVIPAKAGSSGSSLSRAVCWLVHTGWTSQRLREGALACRWAGSSLVIKAEGGNYWGEVKSRGRAKCLGAAPEFL